MLISTFCFVSFAQLELARFIWSGNIKLRVKVTAFLQTSYFFFGVSMCHTDLILLYVTFFLFRCTIVPAALSIKFWPFNMDLFSEY